jgi:hypothetical protein
VTPEEERQQRQQIYRENMMELAVERERGHMRAVLGRMTNAQLVEALKTLAPQLEPKAEDMVREAAARLNRSTQRHG